jgi:acetolactate synthase-1/2/3 large subunit
MADTWGKYTRQLGVCAVSSGPGHVNAITGVMNAAFDGSPMLLISGMSPLATYEMDHFQDIEQVGLVAPLCKYARLVESAAKIPYYVHRAFAAAVSGRPGPVHLTIPADVLAAPVDAEKHRWRNPAPGIVKQNQPGDPQLVREALALIRKARSPFMAVGSGAFYADAGPELARFAANTNIPILNMLWDRTCVEKSIPQYVGPTKAAINGAAALLPQADLVIVVGGRADYRIHYASPAAYQKGTKFIRIDADPVELMRGLEAEVSILGDPRSVLGQLNESGVKGVGPRNRAWLNRVIVARRAHIAGFAKLCRSTAYPIPAARLCAEIAPFLKQDIAFIIDGGNIGQWTHLLLFDRCPSSWLGPGLSGVIAYGIPAAMAIKVSHPDRPVLLLSGDGSATFTIADIERAVAHRLPFVMIIADDGGWGIVRTGQVSSYGKDRDIASRLGPIKFDLLAEALGAHGVRIKSAAEIAPAVAKGLRADRPTVVHVPTAHLSPY